MTHRTALALVAALAATPALASGPTPVPADDHVAPPPAAIVNWSGAYVGLSAGTASGEMNYNDFATIFDLDSAAIFAVFAGYNMQRGNLVFGGELSYTRDLLDVIDFPEGAEDVFELRGRAGYSFGRAMAYGFIGYARGDFFISDGTNSLSGMTYGLGVDVMLTDTMFLGVEGHVRDLDGAANDSGQIRFYETRGANLRLGWRF